jgi:hypothetical protein
MTISLKTVVVFMLLLITTFFMQLSVPAHARRLEVRAPIISIRPPCTGRSALEAHAEQTESTTPGHSPSIGHNSPPTWDDRILLCFLPGIRSSGIWYSRGVISSFCVFVMKGIRHAINAREVFVSLSFLFSLVKLVPAFFHSSVRNFCLPLSLRKAYWSVAVCLLIFSLPKL